MAFKPVAMMTAMLMAATVFSASPSFSAEKTSQTAAQTKNVQEKLKTNQQRSWKGNWVAERIQGKRLKGGMPVTLDIAEDGRISGHSGCNRYMGAMQFDGKNVSVAPVGGTKMACPQRQMVREQRFHTALEQVKGWKMHKGKLIFTDAKDSEVLRLKRAK